MSHGPPDLPIHLVPPLGGLLSTRGGHGKELQPCFTIREDFTDSRPDGGTMGPTEKCCKHGENGTQRRYWVCVVRTMQWLDHRRHTHSR